MQMEKVRERAKKLGVKSARMKKEDLIRAIQKAEGNYPCFGTAVDCCDQSVCCWRDDCLKE
ncbi:MAG: SAP domain-containing protein [Deltaproteobacteria bacterium GWA2_55_10]|nr:MAG: SAP domain-containing protein [Deltaproteobacteria bacterium GWA2_55_10]